MELERRLTSSGQNAPESGEIHQTIEGLVADVPAGPGGLRRGRVACPDTSIPADADSVRTESRKHRNNSKSFKR
ncbi:hypothetical protein GWI33_022874 [Rhynchophorus ferrugineus]|uniref:Uncharacterized protein n=1 Tax=Rhynchophorus ferrugineus TaxID=354439 RepID=A0A834IRX9_RHYFE|nr:hypothetical protein GWI33_022874 [Rhynchophorus ferrugineus]